MNENIISYIKNNYINSGMDPQFAVLVKGDWGSGKTFLVRRILEETYGKNYKDNIIWLSVYGLSTIEQLRKKLFEKIHPILTSKVAKFAFDTVKAGIKATTSLDLNHDNSDDISFDFTIPEFEKDSGDKKVKIKKLLIVDDIERCSIPIIELFGFFSEEILDNKVKAIFISNDQIIKDLEDKSKQENDSSDESRLKKDATDETNNNLINNYRATKEKIIGMEFEVQPDISAAAKVFIKKIGLEQYEKVLVEKTTDVLNNLNYKNLRTIRQAFVHIYQIISILNTKSLDEKYISLVVEYFLVLFIQKANGKIDTENEFLDAIQVYSDSKQTLEEYKKTREKKSYPIFRTRKVPLQNLYHEIIQKGNFSVELICEDYKNWTTPEKEKSPYQKMIDGWFFCNDSEFKNCYKSIEDDFAKNKIQNQMMILNWADYKFVFHYEGIITEKISDIKKYFLNYIKTNQNTLELCESDFFYDQHIISCQQETKSLDEIKEALKKVNANLMKKSVKENFIKIYSKSTINPSEIIGLISYNKYNSYGIPILSLIDVNDFYQKIKNTSYELQVVILQCFQDRFGMKNNDKLKEEYYPETKKIKKLTDLYKKDIGCITMSPENANRNRLYKWYLDLYKYMTQFSVVHRKKESE